MNYTFLYSLTVLCALRSHVISIPVISSIFKGLLDNASNDSQQVVSNKLTDTLAPDIIDLSFYGRSLYGQPDFNYTGSMVSKFSHNESSVNPEELGSYLEGDILIPEKSFILKNGLSSRAYHWPNGQVPFEIADEFEIKDLNIIAFAIDEYHAKTCIRFKPRTIERDYISIVKGNSGCWSAIGRMGGKQLVNLQSPGCVKKPGTVMHELMHVLGFTHEQNRNDRDFFVNIQIQNIKEDAVSDFQILPNTVTFGLEYDYGSVMHYSPIAFSRNGLPTMVPTKPLDGRIMGQRDGFSPLDIEKVNRMYNCEVNNQPPAPPINLQQRVPPRFAINFIGRLFNRVKGLVRFGKRPPAST